VCGIFGTFLTPGQAAVERGLDLLAHRGPDGRGVARSGEAVHGHVRLALLDPTAASAQPFCYRGVTLSYNGELWNHRELKAELQALGHDFRTTGDTEVLAVALDQWGSEALPRLDGMFAFACSGPHGDWLARDRYGKVPLYVLRRGGAFAWSSERKAIDRGGHAVPLPPGSWLDLRTGLVRRWYTLPASAPPPDVPALLAQGVSKRLVADAPVCCLVSGGLDSALSLALARRFQPDVMAYTVVLDPASADLRSARRLCAELGVPLREVTVDPPDAAALAEAAWAIELASKAQVEIAALCLPLARRIAADGFKACLSGEAADELFGGYGNLCIQASRTDDAGWRALRVTQLEKMARGNFVRCNKAFLAAGVECRLPYMERGLVESVLCLGKAECPPGKGLLKRAAEGLLPAWVVRRPKATFQGSSGLAAAAARAVACPVRFYNAEVRRHFGALVRS
jgi:asparagine synthase (glutamine-hydrolysing)